MKLNKNIFRSVDFTIIAIAMMITIIGIIAIYSATLGSDTVVLRDLYKKQAFWLFISIIGFFLAAAINYRIIERNAYLLFFLVLISLLIVEFAGRTAGGSQRWLYFGYFGFQPSEIMKISVILLIARMYDGLGVNRELGIVDMLKPFLLILIPFLLVARQPDLGTASIYIILFLSVSLVHGIRPGTLKLMIALFLTIIPTIWLFLKDYQKKRIFTLLDPESDPTGAGYHAIQSKISIGSGGLFGKGIFEGTQSKLNFLPEKHTDFIFSVIAEETGFIGAMVLFILFFSLIFKLISESNKVGTVFGSMLITGVTSMITFHFLYNIGMTLGLLPIVGITLPFISYGGSSLVTNFIALGLVYNVLYNRYRSDL